MQVKHYEPGKRMSRAVQCGGMLYFSGAVAPAGTEGTAAQTRAILEGLEAALQQYGSGKKQVVSALIHLRDMGDFEEMNTVWDTWVEPGNPPTRTCVEARMARSSVLVEITIVAAAEQ